MHRESGGVVPTPLTRLLAIGWISALAFVYLFRYDGWVIPLQAVSLIAGIGFPGGIGPHFAEFIRGRLLDCGCVLAILVTAFGVGAVVAGRWVVARDLVAALFALAIGLGVLAVAVLVIGVISVPKIPWVFLAGLCWCLPAPRAFLRRREAAADSSLGWAWWAVGIVVVAAVLNLPGTLAPPFEYDELEYHLGAVAEYVSAGRIVFLPHNFYSNLPQLTEMLYLLGSLASSDVAAKLLHWTFGVLTAVAVYALGARLWSRRIGALAAALFYCSPLVQDLSQTARIDLATTFFAALAWGGLLLWREAESGEPKALSEAAGPEQRRRVEGRKAEGPERSRRAERGRPAARRSAGSGWSADLSAVAVAKVEPLAKVEEPRTTRDTDGNGVNQYLWLSAVAVGGAVATKWTAVPVVLLPAMGFVVLSRKSFGWGAAYGLLAVAVVLPWLVKNAVLAGNPVYPLLDRWLPSVYWSADQTALFARKHYPSFGWAGARELFERAWHYSFAEPRAVPLLLMTTPLLLLLPRPAAPGGLGAARRAGWLLVGAYAGWWLLTFRPWRFLFPALPLAALAGAFAVAGLGRASRTVRWLAGSTLAVVVAVSGASLAMNSLVDLEEPDRVPARFDLLQYTLGGATREEFLTRLGHGVFEPVVWMNRHLPATTKILYVGEARAYYAQQPVFWSTAYDQHPLAAMAAGARSVDELRRRLRAEGVTHVYVNFPELQRLSSGYGYLVDLNWNQFRNLLQHQARVVHQSDRRVVYELAP